LQMVLLTYFPVKSDDLGSLFHSPLIVSGTGNGDRTAAEAEILGQKVSYEYLQIAGGRGGKAAGAEAMLNCM
jgi:hypothetical protein